MFNSKSETISTNSLLKHRTFLIERLLDIFEGLCFSYRLKPDTNEDIMSFSDSEKIKAAGSIDGAVLFFLLPPPQHLPTPHNAHRRDKERARISSLGLFGLMSNSNNIKYSKTMSILPLWKTGPECHLAAPAFIWLSPINRRKIWKKHLKKKQWVLHPTWGRLALGLG